MDPEQHQNTHHAEFWGTPQSCEYYDLKCSKWDGTSPLAFNATATRSTEDIRQRKRPKDKAKWDHIVTTYVTGATEKLCVCDFLPNTTTFLCFFKSGKHTETAAVPPRGTHTKTQTEEHYAACAVKWSEKCTACTLGKPNHPSLNTWCTTEERILLVKTRQLTPADRTSFVLTSADMAGIFRVLTACVEPAETDPEGVGGPVLWSLRRSLRLRRRGEFTGLDQGLRLRPDKVVLCLHLWTLPPLDDLSRKERKEGEESERRQNERAA